MLNVTLVGNLGAEATVGATRKGTPLATLRVAVNHVRTDANTGERIDSAEWFRVRAMGRLVDLAQQLTKGTRVLVIGRLDIGHYQSAEGEPRVSHDVWADELIPFSLRPDSEETSTVRTEHDQNRSPQSHTPARDSSRPTPGSQSRPAGGQRRRTDEEDENLPW